MKRKTLRIIGITLTLILCVSAAVYGLTLNGSSSITPGVIVMNAKSTTSTDESIAQTVSCSFYKDNTLVDSKADYDFNITSISVSCSAFNNPGAQFWEVIGIHEAGTLSKESYASTSY